MYLCSVHTHFTALFKIKIMSPFNLHVKFPFIRLKRSTASVRRLRGGKWSL